MVMKNVPTLASRRASLVRSNVRLPCVAMKPNTLIEAHGNVVRRHPARMNFRRIAPRSSAGGRAPRARRSSRPGGSGDCSPACSSDVRGPAGVSGQRERRREQVRREADAHEHRRRVELDVRLEGRSGCFSASTRSATSSTSMASCEPVGLVRHALGDGPQGRGARIVRAVDAMPEAHQPLAAVERLADPGLGVLGGARPGSAGRRPPTGRRRGAAPSSSRSPRRRPTRCPSGSR